MEPIFTTVDVSLSVTIVPVVNGKAANNAALVYHIFKNKNSKKEPAPKAVCYPFTGRASQDNYMGFITFKQPGEIFNYTAGLMKLNEEQVGQIVRFLIKINQHSGLWLF